MKKIYLAVLIFCASGGIFAQNARFDSLAFTGIKKIYNMNFSDAEVIFRKMIADYPEHPAGRFFLSMIDWWKIIVDPDNESYDDIYFQKLEDVIYQCDKLLEKNPENIDALFFKGGAIGFRGRLRAFRESWIKAADDGREALPIVEKASRLDPNNQDVQLGFGIYNYYASVIPNDYPLLKPLMIFFPKGDKQKGIEQLLKTASTGKYARFEARYFLMTLYYSYENNPWEADKYAKQLIDDFPDNPVFQRWEGRIAAKKGDYLNASLIFKNVLDKGAKKMFGYDAKKSLREADYYVGVQYKNEMKLDSAKIYFDNCVQLSKEVDKKEDSGFQINSLLYLGMLNDMQGNRSEAENYYKKLLDMRDYGNSRNLAKKYLDTPYKE